ncbi:MAG TPA: hypothetical protein PLZ08_02780, partial [Bacillota bacterium]|nr:hypothetical protein [Bacillota bacterium]
GVMSLKKSFILVLIFTLALTVVGCGGGGGGKKSSSQPYSLPLNIKDVAMKNGTGTLTIITNDTLKELIAIPYNLSMTAGNYSTTVSINADTGLKAIYSFNTKTPQRQSKSLNHAYQQRSREVVKKLLNHRPVHYYRSHNKISAAAKVQSELNSLEFWKPIENHFGEIERYDKITATKMYESEHCVIYLDDSEKDLTHLKKNNIAQIGVKFDQFRDLLEQNFGSADGVLGDIDGNRRIFILLTELPHDPINDAYLAGVYYNVNDYRNSDLLEADLKDKSNEKEMLYVTTLKSPKWTEEYWIKLVQSIIAHEYQHLINFNNRIGAWKSAEDYFAEIWISEGLSMIAEDLAMSGKPRTQSESTVERVLSYLNNPAASSLCTWEYSLADYAPAYMFMRYFVDRYQESSIKKLIQSKKVGKDIFTDVSGLSFNTIFPDWLAAVAFSSQNYLIDSRLHYQTLNLALPGYALNYYTGKEITIPDTSGVFIRKDVSNCNKITIKVNGDPNFKLRLLLIPKEGKGLSVTYQ